MSGHVRWPAPRARGWPAVPRSRVIAPPAAAAVTPPAFQTIQTTDIATSTTWTLTLPSGVAAGDVLVALLGSDRNTTTTVSTEPAGWAAIPGTTNPTQDAVPDVLGFFYWKKLQAGDPELSGTNPAWTLASASAGWGVLGRYSGADGVNTAASAGGAASQTTHTLPTITTTVNNCLLVAGAIVDKTSTTSPGVYWTPPSTPGAWTERLDAESATFVEVTFADLAQASQGQVSGASFTSVDGEGSVVFVVALAPVGAGGGQSFAQTITDPVGITDAASQAATFDQAASDPVGLLDSITQAAVYQQTVTDAIGLVDAAAASFVLAQALTDPVGITDTVAVSQEHARAITDPVGLTDAAAQVATADRSQTDPVGITDSRSVEAGQLITITDPVGITDAASQVSAAARSQTDPVGITDQITAETSGQILRTITDPVGLADAASVEQATSRSQSDMVGVVDAISREQARDLTDPVGLADATARIAAYSHDIAPYGQSYGTTYDGDEIRLTDSIVVDFGGPGAQTITDLVGITDQVSYVKTDVTPRWVEGTATATGHIDGTSGGTGQVEGALAGVGVIEGASSI